MTANYLNAEDSKALTTRCDTGVAAAGSLVNATALADVHKAHCRAARRLSAAR